ncbi:MULTISPECIES: virB8 family protein [Sphingomonas]|uniref:virB8 family protein n=1 Tax=Sphingomonas TaxID=13687 RepID=UPI000DEEB112|nr:MULTISPECIES: type IV secretion system protein [Sphingomonas]
MNEHSREALDAYYAEAASWNRDRVQALVSSRKVAWWVAIGAGSIAVMEAAALMLLTPLKTVEPYTLLVDRTTGFVQPLKPLDPAKIAPDTALTQSFLVQYVIAREGFDRATIRNEYNKVSLMSADTARASYVSGIQVTNPTSPVNILPPGNVIEARVKSVSPVGPNVAMVRFDTVRSDASGRLSLAMPWVAVVTYRYSGEPMSLESRYVNPLGFQVTKYRRDPEALPIADRAASKPETVETVVTTQPVGVPTR